MLILARKRDEAIVLEWGAMRIRIVAVGASEGRLRIGIEAPKHVKVMREELLDKNKGKK